MTGVDGDTFRGFCTQCGWHGRARRDASLAAGDGDTHYMRTDHLYRVQTADGTPRDHGLWRTAEEH